MHSKNLNFQISIREKKYLHKIRSNIKNSSYFTFLIPVLPIFLLFLIWDYIKTKLFKGFNNIDENTLIKTNNFHLIQELTDLKLTLGYIYTADHVTIFRIKNKGLRTTDLDEAYISAFECKMDNLILYQKIRINSDQLDTSYLTVFDPVTGTITSEIEIGNFKLNKYNPKKQKIIGESSREFIEIKW